MMVKKASKNAKPLLGGENEPIFKKECSSCKTNIMKL
jgi:hypothetical protein